MRRVGQVPDAERSPWGTTQIEQWVREAGWGAGRPGWLGWLRHQFTFPPPLTSHQIQKRTLAYHLSGKRYRSTVHPLEVGPRWGDVFVFSWAFTDWEICDWKQHERSPSHLEMEKNWDPEKTNYLSCGGSRARLEPSLSSPRPMPFLLYSAAFHWLVDDQNWEQMSFFLRDSQAHCSWCPSLDEKSPKVPTVLTINTSWGW